MTRLCCCGAALGGWLARLVHRLSGHRMETQFERDVRLGTPGSPGGRMGAALRRLGAEHQPADGWQDRVIDEATGRPSDS